jgi:hypothetical protein
MNGQKLIEIMGDKGWSSPMNPHANLPRYAAMCGFFDVPTMNTADYRIYGISKVEIPDDLVPKILALHFAEKATTDLRAMGEAMGKMQVNVPSNINVWQHLKGEGAMTRAAQSLAEAAKQLQDTVSR